MTDSAAQPLKPKRSWLRWINVAILSVLALAILLRIAVTILLPIVISRAAGIYRLDVSYDRSSLSILSGNLDLWGLKLNHAASGEKIAVVDHVRGLISVPELFRLRLVVWRAEADATDLVLERAPDGTFPLIETLVGIRKPAEAPAVTDSNADADAQVPVNLKPPIVVEALRLHRTYTRFLDRTISPPLDLIISSDVRISNFGIADKPLRYEIDVWSDPWLDVLRFEGEATTTSTSLVADMRITVRGLRPLTRGSYIRNLGFEPIANEVAADMSGKIVASIDPGDPSKLSASITLGDIALFDDGLEAIGIDGVKMRIDRLGLSKINISRVVVDGVRFTARRTIERRVRFAGLELGVRKNLEASASVLAAATQAVAAAATRPALSQPEGMTPTTGPVPFRIRVTELLVKNASLRLVDQSIYPATAVEIAMPMLEVGTQIAQTATAEEPSGLAPIKAEFQAPGLFNAGSIEGMVRLRTDKPYANVDFSATGVNFLGLQPYIRPMGLESILRSGTLGGHLEADLSFNPDDSTDSNVLLTDLKLADDADVFSLAKLEIKGFNAAADRSSLAVESVIVHGPVVSVRREGPGRIAAAGFRTVPPSERPANAAVPPPPPISLGDIQPVTTSATQPARSSIEPAATPGDDVMTGDTTSVTDNAPASAELSVADAKAGDGIIAKTADAAAETVQNAAAAVTGVAADAATTAADTVTDAAATAAESINAAAATVVDAVNDAATPDAPAGDAVAGPLPVTPTSDPATITLESPADGTAESTEATAATTQPTTDSTESELAKTLGAPSRWIDALPAVRIGRLTWTGMQITYQDPTVDPPVDITVDDAGLEIRDGVFDMSPANSATVPGTVSLWAKVPQVVGGIVVNGTLEPGSDGLATDFNIDASEINLNALDGYLIPLGIESDITSGAIKAGVRGGFRIGRDRLGVQFDLTNAGISDGEKELASIDRMSIDRADLTPDGIEIGTVDADRARLSIARDEDGILRVGNVRLAMIDLAGPNVLKEARAAAQRDVAAEALPAGPRPLIRLPKTTVQAVRINEAELDWTDAVAKTQARGMLSLTAANLAVAADAPPGTFRLDIAAPGVVGNATVEGTLALAPDRIATTLTASGTGLSAGPLGVYVDPKVMSVMVTDGTASAGFDAVVESHPDGGISSRVHASNVNVHDASDPSLGMFAVGSFIADVTRFDPDARRLAIRELRTDGLIADVNLTADGGLSVAGIVLPVQTVDAPATLPAEFGKRTDGPTTAHSELGNTEAANLATTGPTTADPRAIASGAEPAPAAGADQADVQALVAQANKGVFDITLDTMRIGITRVSMLDHARPDAAHLTLADAYLWSPDPIAIGGPDGGSHPPAWLKFNGRVDPIAGNIDLQALASPLSDDPKVTVWFSAQEVSTPGVLKVVPELNAIVDGADLTDGQINGFVTATARVKRRGGLPDFAGGFDLDLTATDLELIGPSDDLTLGALSEIRTQGARITPASGAIMVKELDITRPTARLVHDQQGLHVLGFVIKTESAEPVATPPAETTAVEPATEAPVEPITPWRIDRLLVTELDVTLDDLVPEPPVRLPFTGLDAEVRGLSDKLGNDVVPVRFSIVASSGKVPLRDDKGNELERDLFAQITSSGNVVFTNNIPHGWAKLSIDALELGGFRGLANAQGFELEGGILDTSIDARFEPDDQIVARTRTVVTDLRINEPDGGPVSRQFKLAGSLDSVIGLLEDSSGSITLPVTVTMDSGVLNRAAVMDSVTNAVAGVIGKAVASAPAKLVTGIFGGGGSGGPVVPIPPVVLGFDPGQTSISPESAALLSGVIARMQKEKDLSLVVRHQLSDGDVQQASKYVNIPDEDAVLFAQRLRSRKFQLQQQRAVAAAEVRSGLQTETLDPAAAGGLRELDIDLSRTEDALDIVYEMLRPGADGQSKRRTRAAAIEVAKVRLDEIRRYFVAAGINPARFTFAGASFKPDDSSDGGNVTIELLKTQKK